MQDTEETALLTRVALGDRTAFRELYTLTSGRLFAIAKSMLRQQAAAEDVLQDAYVKIWYSAAAFNPAKGEALAWMITILRNLAIDRLRKTPPTDTDDDLGDTISDTPNLDEEHSRLQECLQALEASQRQSIFAAFFQGLTHMEISARFAEPIGTIKSRVRRGLSALKGCMEL